MNVISRGYAVVNKNDSKINSVKDLNVGDKIKLVIKDGSVIAQVLERSEENDL